MTIHAPKIRANHPVEEILAFRETGYADKLLNCLAVALPDWDIYLHFELSRWKGNDLQIEPSPRRKLVLCVGDESARTNYPFLDKVDMVFRMYLPENQRGKIVHVPVGPSKHFAPPTELVPFAERPRNVFFSGNLHQGRAGLYQALTGMPPLPFAVLHRLRRILGEQFDRMFPDSVIRFSTGFHNGIPPAEYARYLADSKLVLCPSGIESPESMRHFEAASLGCVVITTAMPDVEVYRSAPFVTLGSWRELKPAIAKLLADPAHLISLHARTLDWWHSNASAEAATRHMLHQLATPA